MTRFGFVVTTYFAVLGIGLSALFHPAPRLIWNASASVPIGLYALRPIGELHVGDLLVITPPEPLARFLDERDYLPKGVPLLKRVLALPGHSVCRSEGVITVDGTVMGDVLDRDHLGRPLPYWQGCRVIADGEIFVMNRQPEDSLDSRYFGPLPVTSIVGRAAPLWTRGER